MVGKGSVNHNSRKFKAENVDGERSHFNVDYCNENIKKVYHKLFDEALQRYNDKQTRADRRIADYYEMDLCQYFGQKKSKDYAVFLSSLSSFCCGVK